MEKLYLKPGSSISKKGLPGGTLNCKAGSDPLEIKESLLKVIESNIFHFKASGKVLDQTAYDKFMTVEDKPKKVKKPKKVVEPVIDAELKDLRTQAEELEIEFTDETSVEDLKLLIEDKLA